MAEPYTRVYRRNGRPTSIEFSKCALRVSQGPDAGSEVEIETSTAKVGTSAACALALTDPTVSRTHCEIDVTEDGFLLRDLESTNGTFVNGVRIREAFLEPGASFGVGKTVVEFTGLDERAEIRLSENNRFGRVLGQSIRMREIFYLLERVADKDLTVLLTGETGTGKEVFARSLHELSARAEQPFVTLDCGAIPERLIESELFGHSKGAFTGATEARAGAFESATGGTVFLDEIGELPLGQQTKLLRVLEEREIKRVGESTNRPVDVRVIAATNRHLAEEVQEGRFRQDLFYRLSVVGVEIPPLRDRTDDIPLLAEHFISEKLHRGEPVRITREAMRVLRSYAWPGNVRELRNLLERAILLSEEALIDAEQVLAGTAEGASAPGGAARSKSAGIQIDGSMPYEDARDSFERSYLIDLLGRHDYNISAAARSAGIHRQSIHRLMKKHGLKLEDLNPPSKNR